MFSNKIAFSESKIYLGKHPEGWTTEKGKKSRRSGSKKALALRIATPLQGKEKPLYGQIIASRLRSLNLDHSAEVRTSISPYEMYRAGRPDIH